MRLQKFSKLVVAVATVAVAVSFAQAQKQPQAKKEELSKVSAQSNITKSLHFESADVLGYIDNKDAVLILDVDNTEADPISLNRSFKDALKANIDKETIERVVR